LKQDALRQHVLDLLDGGRAHARAKDVLAGFPKKLCGKRPRGAPHSGWQLLEHLRIAQRDILDYCRIPDHQSPEWPAGFWPRAPKPTSAAAWDRSARAFLTDLRSCLRVARDRRADLLAEIPHAEVSWLHELLLIADHNAWHLGQLLQLQRQLEA
jgi:hypothetical protein